MVEQDYYDLLGVQRGADEAAIKAAYRRLAKECHPDRHNGCRDQEARFKAVSEAYDVLKDANKRAAAGLASQLGRKGSGAPLQPRRSSSSNPRRGKRRPLAHLNQLR